MEGFDSRFFIYIFTCTGQIIFFKILVIFKYQLISFRFVLLSSCYNERIRQKH